MINRLLRNIGPVEIADDRGLACPLVGPPERLTRTMWLGRRDIDAAMEAELEWSRQWGGTFGIICACTFMLPGALAQTLLGPGAGWSAWGTTFAGPVLLGLAIRPLAPVVARSYRAKLAPDLRAAYLRVCRCACCGYELLRLPTAADGCTHCPECGCAWRV